MSKTTFILVPGAGHRPDIYLTVMHKLYEHGYPAIPLALPSNSTDPPHETFKKDVKAIRDAVITLVDVEKKEVVLVLHAYAGIPGVEATTDLSKKERHAKGLEGGVAMLVLIAAFRMVEGYGPAVEGGKIPEWQNHDFEKGIVTINPEDAKKIFSIGLSPDEEDKWASELTLQRLRVSSSKSTDAAWLHIHSIYIGGDQDETVPVPGIVDRINEQLQRKETLGVERIQFRCRAEYCLMISHPQWLFEMLIEIAEYGPL